MIFQNMRSSSKKGTVNKQQDTQRKKRFVPGSRSSTFLNDFRDEKKENSNHTEPDTLPIQRVAAPAPVPLPSFRIDETAAASVIAATKGINLKSIIQSGKTNPIPVDLDESIDSEDSSYRKREGFPMETMKERSQDQLPVGLGSPSQIFSSECSSGNDEGGGHGCLLFEDEDHDRYHEDLGLPAGDLPTPLLPSVLFVPPRIRVDAADVSVRTNSSKVDEPETASVPKTRSGSKPPAEININLDDVPPSPMRDYVDAFTQGGGGDLPLMLPPNSTDSPPGEMDLNFGAKLGLRTKLCDAERLVRIILGKKIQCDSSQNRYAILEHGSILQAIRSFAMMKAELIELRRQQESSDGDPPAILTNLTSPASTRQTSSYSTPAQSISPKIVEQPSSSLSPDTQGEESVDWGRQLKTTRNALVMAARKCQSLEQQLKQANETIDKLQLEQNPEHCTTIQSLEERIVTLEAENRQLQNAQGCDASRSSNCTTPAELEVILSNLHGVPASSVSQEERQKIRKYVLDMIDSTKDQNQKLALIQSQKRESDARRSLKIAEDRILSLEAKLNNFTSNEANDDDVVPNPLEEACRQLERKDERIKQLEDSQERLQSILQLTAAKCQPLQESSPFKGRSASERLRCLQMEHHALAESVRALEGQIIDL